jgi:hypothetical protein
MLMDFIWREEFDDGGYFFLTFLQKGDRVWFRKFLFG